MSLLSMSVLLFVILFLLFTLLKSRSSFRSCISVIKFLLNLFCKGNATLLCDTISAPMGRMFIYFSLSRRNSSGSGNSNEGKMYNSIHK